MSQPPLPPAKDSDETITTPWFAASGRLLESRAELHDVRDFLGHSNITTTSRYLRSTTLRLERALTLLEQNQDRHARLTECASNSGRQRAYWS